MWPSFPYGSVLIFLSRNLISARHMCSVRMHVNRVTCVSKFHGACLLVHRFTCMNVDLQALPWHALQDRCTVAGDLAGDASGHLIHAGSTDADIMLYVYWIHCASYREHSTIASCSCSTSCRRHVRCTNSRSVSPKRPSTLGSARYPPDDCESQSSRS